MSFFRLLTAFPVLLIGCCGGAKLTADQVDFQQQPGRLQILVNGAPIATYVYADKEIPRPYFAHVKALGGQQVTRNHPPVEGVDATDHATMHPGIWMAFGDLDGSDFWRNKAKIIHDRFVSEPRGGDGSGYFVEQKRYLRDDGSVVCNERFECKIEVREHGYLLIWDSTFSADSEFYFGDQEEMGVGIRVATQLTEKSGGQLSDSEGRRGADSIWSQAAKWCDYSGTIDGKHLGMTLLCHQDNFRASWMHARDYGFAAANPFGRKAMNKGELSRLVVASGESLRLQYGVWVHSDEANRLLPEQRSKQLDAVYADYIRLAADHSD